MAAENSKESNIKSAAEVVKAVIENVPIYQDVVQPAAKQIGHSLEIVSKTVNIALAPIRGLVWGFERIEEFITNRVAQKLSKVSPDNIITPAPQIAGPTAEALRYAGHEDSLRELYANLLATAMDKDTASKAHPGYVEIIKNLSPDEAVLLKRFISDDMFALLDLRVEINSGGFRTLYRNVSNFENDAEIKHRDLIPGYIDNLCRLGLLEIPGGITLTSTNFYDELKKTLTVTLFVQALTNQFPEKDMVFEKKMLQATSFGKMFIENVVKDR